MMRDNRSKFYKCTYLKLYLQFSLLPLQEAMNTLLNMWCLRICNLPLMKFYPKRVIN